MLLGREVRLKFRVNCLTLSCWFSSTLGPFSEGSVKLTFGSEYFAATNLPKIRSNEFHAAVDRNCEKRSLKMNKFLNIIWFQILVRELEVFKEDLEEDLEDQRRYQ